MVDVPVYQSVFSPLPQNPSLMVGGGNYASGGFYGPSAAQQTSNNDNNSGGISDLFDYIPSSDFGGFNPIGNITSGVDKFGTSFGFAPGTVTYGEAFGPAFGGAEIFGPGLAEATPVAGSLGTTATLSGVLGAAGLGAMAGGFLNKGNPTAGSIGGGLGAGIGMALGGPIGAVAGTLLGGLGSRLFGSKKPKTIASQFLGTTDETGALAGLSYGSKGTSTDEGKAYANEIQNYTRGLQKTLGVDLKGASIYGGYSTQHGGGFYTVNGKDTYFFDVNDNDSKNAAIDKVLTSVARNAGVDDTRINGALDNLNRRGKYANNGNNAVGTPANIPTYSAPAPTQAASFDQFLANYKSQQNVNAA